MRVKVIGVGNGFQGDDGAGIVCAEHLSKVAAGSVVIECASGEGADLLSRFEDSDAVFVIDAARSSAAAGTVHRFDAAVDTLPTAFFHYSSHAFGVAEAIELGRALGKLPIHLIVYGIEGAGFEPGMELSPDVEQAVSLVAGEIAQAIGALQNASRNTAERRA